MSIHAHSRQSNAYGEYTIIGRLLDNKQRNQRASFRNN